MRRGVREATTARLDYDPGTTNKDIAQALLELADLAEVAGEPDGHYRMRSLRRAARIIERMTEPAVELAQRRRLKDIRGIGDGIRRRVTELAETGRLAELEEQRLALAGLLEIAKVEGIGPTTTRLLAEQAKVRTLDELEGLARAGLLQNLPAWNAKREAQILAAIERARAHRGRLRLDRAEREAAPFLEAVRAVPGVLRAELAGSLRRRKETVGDVDILVATNDPLPVASAFVGMKQVEAVLASGMGRSSLVTFGGLQIDLRCIPPEEFGAALHHLTGSKEHNIQVRVLALRRGLKITEHGIFEGPEERRVSTAPDEIDVFRAVGLGWIPPELRENAGEIERSLAGTLPRILERTDVRGDLHVHRGNDLDALARAAAERGLEYLAVCGATDEDVRRIRTPRILKAVEVEILEDGRLALPASKLAGADWVIGAVHADLDLPAELQTARLVSAIESGAIDALAHPTNRILEGRRGLSMDLDQVIAAAASTGVALEIHADPERLDLGDVAARIARDRSAWIFLGTGASRPEELDRMARGVDVARRAWLEPLDVLNTRSAADLLDLVRARRQLT